MTPLDVSTLGTIIGKLQNASSATANGLHEDARDEAKRAGELLIGMLGWYVGANIPPRTKPGVSPTTACYRLVAAKERLGVWLAADCGRAWDRGVERDTYRGHEKHTVDLYDGFDPNERGVSGFPVAKGTGPDLASAILAALGAAQEGGGRG